MISGVGLFATLGILAGVGALTLRTLCVSATVTEQRGTVLLRGVSSGALQTGVHLCLGFSCLFALAAGGEFWLSLQEQESQVDVSVSSAWGALWVYVVALLLEFRGLGLSGAGHRAFRGWLLATVGVLFVGGGLNSWSSIHPTMDAACANGAAIIDATGTEVGAAGLGIALVPLAGFALQGTVPKVPPLTIAAACVVLATWMQPLLPSLGWLPLSVGAGAAYALLLALALLVLGLLAVRGPALAVGGVSAYFALSVGGCVLMNVF